MHIFKDCMKPPGQYIGIPFGFTSPASPKARRNSFLPAGIKCDILKLGQPGLAGWQAVYACGFDPDIEPAIIAAVIGLEGFDHFVVI